MIKTITGVRDAFWDAHPEYKKEYRKTYRQNDYRVDIRCAFVEYVDVLHRDKQITDKLANRVTL